VVRRHRERVEYFSTTRPGAHCGLSGTGTRDPLDVARLAAGARKIMSNSATFTPVFQVFIAVDDPVAAVALRGGLHVARIGAVIGLGNRIASANSPAAAVQQQFLLMLGAELEHHFAPD